MLGNIRDIIQTVRKIVKLFRKSPTKNDVLQNNLRMQFSKEKALILDSKTRWNSLLTMLERFYEIGEFVKKTLYDIDESIMFVSQKDFALIYEIIYVLRLVKIAVEALCKSDSNLLAADVTIKFMLDELTKLNQTKLGNDLKEKIIIRFKERRTVLSDVLQLLHDPCSYDDDCENYGVFNISSKTVLKKK